MSRGGQARNSLIRARAVLLVPFLTLIVALVAAPQERPLTYSEVLQLLTAGVSGSRVAQLVEARGTDFEVTPSAEAEARKAGASDELIVVLKLAARLNQAARSAETGTLTVDSQPGEAEVYLNDSPKGNTSKEGKLVLPGLPPGTYRLRVWQKGYQNWERAITVSRGTTHTLVVTLSPKSPEEMASPQASDVTPKTAAPNSKTARAASTAETRDLLSAARTLCIFPGSGTGSTLMSELRSRLLKWGKLTQLSSPEKADLVLTVERTEYHVTATLKSRESGVVMWSFTKSRVFQTSISMARALAGEFIKFFELSTIPAGKGQ